jgi:predicted AAA+ superfamily ATPase
MAEPSREQLLEALHMQNPWWAGKSVPAELTKPFRRRDFFFLRKRLADPQILAIYGPRQVGKTTVMYQLVAELMEAEKVEPRRVLFYSLDYPGTAGLSGEFLNQVLEAFSTSILKEPLERDRAPVYVFLDEVAKAEGWSRVLKGWQDLRLPLKFVVSDSSQSRLLGDAARDLVGRVDLQLMLPLKFSDFLAYRLKREDLGKSALDWREEFSGAVREGSPSKVLHAFERIAEHMAPMRRKAQIELERYFLLDGYPELLDCGDLPFAASRLRQYVDLTLYKDLVRLFEIRNPKALEDLVTLIAAESSKRMDYQTLSGTLRLKYETLKTYLDYLESVFLVTSSGFYTGSRAKRIRRPRKMYFRNCGLRNAILGELHESTLSQPERLGITAETVVFEHTLRLAFHLRGGAKPELGYWQDSSDREVDIVFDVGPRPLAIEVKFRASIRDSDIEAIRSFIEEHPKGMGLVVTRSTLERRGDIVLVPLWIFLLMC